MNENQYCDGHAMAPNVSTQESIRNAEAQIAKGRADLERAKVKELNEKLQEVQILRRAIGCPATVYVLNGDGVALVEVDKGAAICTFEQTALMLRRENG
ncbi:hypothetical protein [Komagataeibacter xylinus]|uniref:Uncharacterized protein n=1 Tax=Komagataeibacter xylinus TaxID=28448 RepID=A0A857FQ98_KOMXY|nr:hypothetical protein [Komagataeibacter xylinus]QHC36443.1 hypothetical protein FMA36_13890 [Komagataeibacter xylinus]